MPTCYPVLSIDRARAYEAEVLASDTEKTRLAMLNAGRAIGRGILADYQEIRDWPELPRILVLAGKGLNSGDAFVACVAMQETLGDLQVQVVMTEDESKLNPLAVEALGTLRAALGTDCETLSVETCIESVAEPYDVVIDGLYGHGFRPPLRAAAADLLRHVNSRTDIAMRVAVDLPSGLGTGIDENCFVSDITYIPGVAKAPCFDPVNAHVVGRLRFLEIPPFLEQSTENHRHLVVSSSCHTGLNILRRAQSDKRNYGHCLVIAGSTAMPGAAIMATQGALHAGAGLVTTCTGGDLSAGIVAAAPEAMWRSLPLTNNGDLDADAVRMVLTTAEKCQAALIGPGLVLSRSTVLVLNRIVRELRLPLVVDASALVPEIVEAVASRHISSGPAVVTPHMGEFSRLSGIAPGSVTNEHLVEYSRKYRVHTVLKGSPTRISDGRGCYSAAVGGPVLARGGAGDILAGMLVTLLAQSPRDPLEAAINAVCWHGAAADLLARERGAIAVRTTDLLDFLADALRTCF